MVMRHLVIDVQILMIASGRSSPPDDGTSIGLLNAMKESDVGRLVWDDGNVIKNQYEEKLGKTTFGMKWLEELLLAGKVIAVQRCPLSKNQRQAILDTGLVGEDLQYYVRTVANSPDRRLVSHDSDYDSKTRKVLKKELDVVVCTARRGAEHLRR